jgi:hypothetical protein
MYTTQQDAKLKDYKYESDINMNLKAVGWKGVD